MQRYFVEIGYDGTNYAGWQKQPNVDTVQETIEKNLSKLYSNKSIDIVGCGRTDAGVHSSQFYFHADLSNKYSCDQLVYKLNNMLPKDIAVYSAHNVNADSHARFDALNRTYRYFIHSKKSPFLNNTSWYFSKQLDLDAMNQASKVIMGEKDFTSFSKLHTDVKTNRCDVKNAKWIRKNDHEIYFEITANRFLRNMVRAIVGTLIDVGLGNSTVEDVSSIIKAKDRGQAGMSVPAHGLFLCRVSYPYIQD